MNGFNPTMVRLLQLNSHFACYQAPTFQSHNGAIAAGRVSLCAPSSSVVSIPQWCDCCPGNRYLRIEDASVSIPQWCDCCNSTGDGASGVDKFQSHNGAIAATFCCSSSEGLVKFQSHNGAIAASAMFSETLITSSVSIPQWCDCCYIAAMKEGVEDLFQSHNGAIAALTK